MCKIPDYFLKELSRKYLLHFLTLPSEGDVKLQFLKLSKLGPHSRKSKIIWAFNIFDFYERSFITKVRAGCANKNNFLV